MAILEHFFKLFCKKKFKDFIAEMTYGNCSKSVKSYFKMTFFSTTVFDPFLTTKRLKTDSRFDYLTVLKTTKAPVATVDPAAIIDTEKIVDLTTLSHRSAEI